MNASFYYSVCFQSLSLFWITVILVVPFATSTTTTFVTRNLAQNETDEVALKAFKSKIIQDPQGVLNSWNDSSHFCEWEGITCGRMHRRVTALNLSSKGLSGSLSPYIGNLSFLKELELYNNSIQGEIPHEFGRLLRLKVAHLYDNFLVGEIPTNLSHCSELKELLIGGNKLVGKIPSEFVSLYNLKTLASDDNNLTGGVPSFLGNLTSLEIITIAYNALGGYIPDSFDQLRKLRFLILGGNNLVGTIPPSIFYNLSSLQILNLGGNQLHGSFPSNLGLTLPNLVVFITNLNLFSGSIPISLSNASKLQVISLAGNNFSGKVSVDFGGMKDLKTLYLGLNNLGSGEVDEMNFMNSLANCSNFMFLSMGANKLSGVLPNSIANFSTKVQRLEITDNQLYGSISPWIANLVNLNVLALMKNQFTGTIPREIGKLQNLQRVALSDNQLSGEIPSSMGNLSLMELLYLGDNKLSGAIPSSLGNLKHLSQLDLSRNSLSGTIPKELFNIPYFSIFLKLAQNHLVGSIPPSIGNLKVLTEFDVSDNNLSGEIPNEIGLCSSFEHLNLEGNFFNGSIPPSLSSLKGIRRLDLSRNNLSGHIPKFLETLPLEKLNLSFNAFEGKVPLKGIFTNASAISIAGNNRLCGGIDKLQLPKCPNNNPKKDKITLQLKIAISTTSVVLGLIVMSSFIFCWLKKRRKEQASGSTMEKSLWKVSYEMLMKATDGFSPTHLIGVGSFGSVYKGIFYQDGVTVAIKVLNLQRQGAYKSFVAECKALKNIRHRNLVEVITSCSSIDFQDNDFKAIVYEFMSNGSLEKWLHPSLKSEEEQNEIQSLTILQRISIAIDVASAIEYLHHHCQEPVLHCDLKPSNVLLDDDMTAHVGDFGLVRFLPEVPNPNQSSSVGVKGTTGYAAPEYGLGNEMSTNGDVYSYGILLLEMVTRKNPTNAMFKGDLNLHRFARMALPDQVMNIVDPMLIDEEMAATDHMMREALNDSRKECLISMVRIGVTCSMATPQDRMNISRVVHELQWARKILLQATTGFDKQRRQ